MSHTHIRGILSEECLEIGSFSIEKCVEINCEIRNDNGRLSKTQSTRGHIVWTRFSDLQIRPPTTRQNDLNAR